MVTVVPGSEFINSTLYVVAQSLLLPVLVILLGVLVYVVIEAGGVISEYSMRRKTSFVEVEDFIYRISNPGTPENINRSCKYQ